jgi:hypothetical protein
VSDEEETARRLSVHRSVTHSLRALLDGLFEYSSVILAPAPYEKFQPCALHQPNFSAAC